ncbi:MAG: M48 family metallopeptidase [Thermosphaera aggregans]|jgi:predicted metal-dependent hydrolase|uniref:M48 metallopeptidase family protein n=1 Tax=Thermosphaera aggregans TaxID=54254 RepID=UPI003C0E8024
MNYAGLVEEILKKYKEELGISDEVRVKIKKYKTRSAFINLKTKTIFINENLLELGEEVVKYLIVHELIHLKLNNRYHSAEFNRILYTYISPEKASEIRGLIANKLMTIMQTSKTKIPEPRPKSTGESAFNTTPSGKLSGA